MGLDIVLQGVSKTFGVDEFSIQNISLKIKSGEINESELLEEAAEIVQKMKDVKNDLTVNKRCERIIERSEEEAELPATYYTLDEIASMVKSAPLKLIDAVERLRSQGYKASTTSLNPGGFRTNCEIDKITQIFQDWDIPYKYNIIHY